MTQHQIPSVNSGFSKLNSSGIPCCAVARCDSSPRKHKQTQITADNTGESRVALGIETITFSFFSLSLHTAPCSQAENESGEGKSVSRSDVPPLPWLAEVPDMLAQHTALH